MCVIGTKKPLAKCQARLQQQQQLLLVPMSNANAAGVSRFDLIAKVTGCLLLLTLLQVQVQIDVSGWNVCQMDWIA